MDRASALELSAPGPVTPASMLRADISDLVEVTDIVVTRTGRASFERAHSTFDTSSAARAANGRA